MGALTEIPDPCQYPWFLHSTVLGLFFLPKKPARQQNVYVRVIARSFNVCIWLFQDGAKLRPKRGATGEPQCSLNNRSRERNKTATRVFTVNHDKEMRFNYTLKTKHLKRYRDSLGTMLLWTKTKGSPLWQREITVLVLHYTTHQDIHITLYEFEGFGISLRFR